MHHIAKFIRKLDGKRRARVQSIIASILRGDLRELDVKSLKGYRGFFRCRIEDVRIIFFRNDSGHFTITDIDYRGKIYRRWQ